MRAIVMGALLLLGAGGAGTAAHAQRPGSAVLDLPGVVPDWAGMLTYGRGRLPVHGVVNTFGGRVLVGGGNGIRGAGAAVVTGGDIDGAGWSVDAVIGRRLREPHGLWGRAVAARLLAAYTHAPAEDGAVKLIDGSAVMGLALQGNAPMGMLELWAAPRLHVRRIDSTVGVDIVRTRVGPGLSWGLGYATRANVAVGFNVAGDVLLHRDGGSWNDEWAFGVALHIMR